MKTTTNTLLTIIAVVLILTATSFASLVSTGSSGGGGFGVVLPTEPTTSGEIQQSMNLNGFNANLYASNESAWSHSYTDKETGETYSHLHPQQSNGSFWFNLDQGFMGQNYLPTNQSTRINRWNDNGNFNIETSFTLLFTDEVQNWINPPQASMNWNLFGMNYNTNTSLRHEENWFWEEDSSEGYSLLTDNIVGDASFSFRDSIVNFAPFSINETEEWHNGAYYPGMRINVNFDIQYIGSQSNLATLNSMIPMSAVPEPATMAILALGGLLLRKRK